MSGVAQYILHSETIELHDKTVIYTKCTVHMTRLSLQKKEDEQSLCRSASYVSDTSQLDTGSYGTLFSQIQEVSTESEGPLEFVLRVIRVLWSSRMYI